MASSLISPTQPLTSLLKSYRKPSRTAGSEQIGIANEINAIVNKKQNNQAITANDCVNFSKEYPFLNIFTTDFFSHCGILQKSGAYKQNKEQIVTEGVSFLNKNSEKDIAI